MDVKWKPPTDVILKAREIVLANLNDRDTAGADSFGAYLAAGLRDDSPEMRIAVAALREGERIARNL